MVLLNVSHDGAVHKDSVSRWKYFASDIQLDWVQMAQNVLRYNVVIVRKIFNKGSWVSEKWRKEHPEELAEELEGPPERIATAAERREMLSLEYVPVSGVCAVFGNTTYTCRSADACWKGKPKCAESADQSTNRI